GRLETIGVERAVGFAELHEVNAGQVAGRVVQEHVLAARIRRVDAAAVRAGVPAVDRRVVLHAGIAAVPRTIGHAVHDLAGRVGRAGLLRIGDPVGRPIFVLLDGLHEVVGDADRDVRVLEHDRAVGLAVEVRLVAALLNEDASLLFFLPLALDEFHHVWMPDFDGLHLRAAATLATALYYGCNLVVDAHEGER